MPGYPDRILPRDAAAAEVLAQEAFKSFLEAVADAQPETARAKPLEIWFQEFAMEAAIGLSPWQTHASASRAR